MTLSLILALVATQPVEVEQAVPTPPAAAKGGFSLEPFVFIVGGMDIETLQKISPDDQRQDRVTTLAMSRFGAAANVGSGLSLLSEFEANSGPHGTSVWEGQAALQVRRQLASFQRAGWRIDAGRIIDDASIDYFSEHVADQLMTDAYTEYPLLASGANLGNGVLVQYELLPGLRPGITLNAANPTSTSASVVLGGTYPPFSRFYFAPAEQVGRDANKYPSDEYYIIILSPSVIYRTPLLETQLEMQFFSADTNTSSMADPPIRGYNVRGGASLHLGGDQFHPFINASLVKNGVLDAMGDKITEVFTGATVSGGLDWNFHGRDGIGFEWAYTLDQQGTETRTAQHFINIGGTWWIGDTTAVGARVGIHMQCADQGMGCQNEGERSVIVTLRTALSARL